MRRLFRFFVIGTLVHRRTSLYAATTKTSCSTNVRKLVRSASKYCQ